MLASWLGDRSRLLKVLGAVLIVVPALVWLGWAFDAPFLMGLGNNLTPMNPLTALCFAALGVHNLIVSPRKNLIAAGVLVIGFVSVCAAAMHATWFGDQIFFHSLVVSQAVPNRIAASTGFCFLLLGAASILAELTPAAARLAAQLVAMAAGLVSLYYLNGYALSQVNHQPHVVPMALNTAFLMLIAAGAVLMASCEEGLMGVIAARTLTARTARRLLWTALILPFLLSLAVQLFSRLVHTSVESNICVLVTLMTAAFILTIWAGSIPANRMEQDMRAVQAMNVQTMDFFRTIIDEVPNIVCVKNQAGEIVLANRATAALFGYKCADDLVGIPIYDLVPKSESIEPLWKADRLVKPKGGIVDVPLIEIVDADGADRCLQIGKVAVPALNGADYNVLTVAADVTELVRSERAIEAAANEIIDLYDNAPCGYHSLDPNGLVIQMNQTELDWLGYTREEVVGVKHFNDLLDPDHVPRFFIGFHRFQQSGDLSEVESVMIRKDGAQLPIVVTSKAVRDEYGRFTSCRTTVFDLSERRATERQVRQAKDEAERANRAKSEFLSRMSHELRTPLNAILGFAQMLQLEKHGERVDQSVAHILKGGRHLLGMINEILDLSRIDMGKLSVSLEPVDLALIVRDASEFIQPLAKTHVVTVGLDDRLSEPSFVRGDQQRLRQICLNLLSNAIKYNYSGGSIHLTIERDADLVRLSVADNGVGVAPDRIHDLFSPFARLGAEAGGVEGTGLGLALSQGLAQYMGGAIRYRPNEPRGSIFTLELLPEQAPGLARVPEMPSPIAQKLEADGATWQVLLVEDNLSNVALMSRIFESRPEIEFHAAMTGEQGIEMAQSLLPDLIFLDVNLPDLTGREVLRAIRADSRTSHVPVVVTSADATEKQIGAMLSEGALDYLTKPLDVTKIYKVIDHHLLSERQVA